VTSSVVDTCEIESGIIQVTLQDRTHRNSFSSELIDGLSEAFHEIGSVSHYRAVIVTGYDTYFASGGTMDALLLLHEGKASCADITLSSLPVDCEVPVIAAMQGHAIGGGLVFGLCADFVVLSRESVYTANFMKYGFTPGMGATYILPRKLGFSLAEEILTTARSFRGAELEKRGVPFPVLPRAEVLKYSRELARDIAEKPRCSLVALKRHLVAQMRRELRQAILDETALHEETIHQVEVADRIMNLFGK
jgi:polyketide biosynthesis enoyl-CoA hydratase PksI